MSSAKKGFVQIMSGTLLAQVITFLLIPVLSRLYSPEDFGALTLITSLATMVVPFASLRMDTAMMLPKETAQVRALLFIGLFSTLTFSTITGIIVAIFLRINPEMSSVPWIPFWVFLTIVLASVFSLLNRLALRKSGFGQVGKRAVMQSAGTGAGQISLSVFPGNGLGLVIGNIIGRCVGILPLFFFTREFFGKPDTGLAKSMLRRYWRFPVVFAPSSALNSFGVQAPLIFVSAWFGVASAGILGMAERIIGVPMTLIGNAASQVLDSEIAKKMRSSERDFTKVYLRASWSLGIVALIVGSGFFFLGEWVIPLLLGEEWGAAGTCVKIMSITVALRLVATPTGVVISLFEESSGMLMIDATRTLLIIGTMGYIVAVQASFISAVLLIYSSLSLVYFMTWCFGWYVVRKHSIADSR